MRLVFVADGRSPIALNWIRNFTAGNHEVHLASLYPCRPELELASLTLLPSLLKRFTPDQPGGISHEGASFRGGFQRLLPVGLRTALRQWLVPMRLQPAAEELRNLLKKVKPDLVHAMRIPYEGMAAALAEPDQPLVTSVWGNDFTLHAGANAWMAGSTRLCMARTTALHTDCQRDQRLARQWGFADGKPAVVLPGGGGVQLDVFFPAGVGTSTTNNLPKMQAINPRGMRAYVRNDVFFQAVQQVGERLPAAAFICTGMAGDPQAERWVRDLGLQDKVELLPQQSRSQMAELFRCSAVSVSPSMHDGTPNTLLEAMACGCFPVAGDIESLREWITPGVNGDLVDPGNPEALAEAIINALLDPALRARAGRINRELIAGRADYRKVMPQAEYFYRSVIQGA